MGIWDKMRGASNGRQATATRAVRRPEEMIKVYDERGRELQIRRDEWARSVLPNNLKAAWDDAQKLYSQIVAALNDDFPEQVVEAADHLARIDPDAERAALVLAVVKLKTHDLAGSEAVLRAYIEKHGETGMVLSNLAKVYAERKDTGRMMELLRRAIDLDPNQDNGLLWWVALHREQGGEAAAANALRAAADRPGAWRPQLWLAREHLKRGEADAAVSLYQHVLARAAAALDVLVTISGDLGNAGQLEALVRLDDPEKHGPHAGFNLIEAFKRLGRFDEARGVLGTLQAQRLAPFAEHLARVDQSLAEARIAAEGPESIPAVGAVVFEDPIWTRGLFDPSWLLPRRAPDGPLLTVFALANGTLAGTQSRSNLPDLSSRFSRAVALYLAERLRFDLEIGTRCILFAARGKGVAAFREVSPVSVLAPTALQQGRPSYGLSGIVQQDSVRLDLWNAASQATESVEIQGSIEAMGDWVKAIESAVTTRVRVFAGVAAAAADPFTARPPDALLPGYCSALDQLVYQVLAANKLAPTGGLFNERAMFETYLSLADAWSDAGLRARMLATCGVVAAVRYGSAVAPTYARIVQRWYESAGRETQLGMLAPAVLLRIGARDAFETAMGRVEGIGENEYVAWLERVRAGSKDVS